MTSSCTLILYSMSTLLFLDQSNPIKSNPIPQSYLPHYPAKDGVLVVQVLARLVCDEELRSVRVRPGVGHAQHPALVVRHAGLELVPDLSAPEALAPLARARRVTPLTFTLTLIFTIQYRYISQYSTWYIWSVEYIEYARPAALTRHVTMNNTDINLSFPPHHFCV